MAIRSAVVEPDSPVLRVDASNVNDLPDDVREALSVVYSPEQVAEAEAERAAAVEYHSEQASTVLSHAGWTEIEANWLDRARAQAEGQEFTLDAAVRTFVYDPDGREYNLMNLPEGGATIHQFYEDLYGLGASVWNCNNLRVLVNHRDRKHPYQMYDDYLRFISGAQRETSFIYMGTFWVPPNGYLTARSGAMTTIGGFCVDIDRVDDDKGGHFPASMFIGKLFECLEAHPEVMPNYIHLSGTGVQLWYVFGRLIPLLSAKRSPRRGRYNNLLKALYGFFQSNLQSNLFKVDTSCAHINCALRAPGSPAKMHYPTRLFVRNGADREMVDPLDLADFLGVDDFGFEDTVEWDEEWQREWQRMKDDARERREAALAEPATEKQLGYISRLHDMRCLSDAAFARAGDMSKADADAAIKAAESEFARRGQFRENGGYIKTSAGHAVARKPRDRGLYEYTLRRIPADTPTGTRYWALFGLAGLAWNCCVPKAELRRDMEALVDTDWARETSKDGRPLDAADVAAAMRGYNELGALRARAQLEAHLGWEYEHSKRNGRSSRDHLWGDWYVADEDGDMVPVVNTARENRRLAQAHMAKKRKRGAVERLAERLAADPASSKRMACEALGMSRSTVTKYWAEACAAAGIEDTRSGNHRR